MDLTMENVFLNRNRQNGVQRVENIHIFFLSPRGGNPVLNFFFSYFQFLRIDLLMSVDFFQLTILKDKNIE